MWLIDTTRTLVNAQIVISPWVYKFIGKYHRKYLYKLYAYLSLCLMCNAILVIFFTESFNNPSLFFSLSLSLPLTQSLSPSLSFFSLYTLSLSFSPLLPHIYEHFRPCFNANLCKSSPFVLITLICYNVKFSSSRCIRCKTKKTQMSKIKYKEQ